MARPTLWNHRKFRRLTLALKSKALAVGVLECMWACGYDSGDNLLGTSEEVEVACGWSGRKGHLTPVLEEIGWIDASPDGYRIHDLYDHAPDYVQKRMRREETRRQRPDGDRTVTGQQPDGDRPLTPTPTPTPAPTPTPKEQLPSSPPPASGAPPGSRKRPPGEEYTQEFTSFWNTYPRKVGKASAWRAWRQLAGKRPPIGGILEALAKASATEQWQRDGGQFVPHPATWLRRGGWEDELEIATGPDHAADEFFKTIAAGGFK